MLSLPALGAIKRVAVGLNVLADQPLHVAGIRHVPLTVTQLQKNLSVLREFGPILEHFKAVQRAVPFMKDPAIMQEKKLSLLKDMPKGSYVLFPFQRKGGMPAA
jgi:hypothetical protein